jgi:hypothetical protein
MKLVIMLFPHPPGLKFPLQLNIIFSTLFANIPTPLMFYLESHIEF